jgi:hypothetical protein
MVNLMFCDCSSRQLSISVRLALLWEIPEISLGQLPGGRALARELLADVGVSGHRAIEARSRPAGNQWNANPSAGQHTGSKCWIPDTHKRHTVHVILLLNLALPERSGAACAIAVANRIRQSREIRLGAQVRFGSTSISGPRCGPRDTAWPPANRSNEESGDAPKCRQYGFLSQAADRRRKGLTSSWTVASFPPRCADHVASALVWMDLAPNPHELAERARAVAAEFTSVIVRLAPAAVVRWLSPDKRGHP